jgi:hypothetical protein
MSNYGVVLLHNTSSVMRAEKVLQKGGLAIKLIPTPREFSSDCGMAVRFDLQDRERVRLLLDQAHVEVAEIHAMHGTP